MLCGCSPGRGSRRRESILSGSIGEASVRIVTGALLSLVSFALFLVFASAFRTVLVELEKDELHANMAFAGVLMVVAAGFGAEGINMAAALRAADGHLGETLAQGLFETSYVFGYNGAGIGLGVLLSRSERRRCERERCYHAGSPRSRSCLASSCSLRSLDTCSPADSSWSGLLALGS